ncbi:hypothetical protein ACHAW6_012153 [Cyclotella cf. meneghiniana]
MFGVSRKKAKATKKPLSFAASDDDDDDDAVRSSSASRRKRNKRETKEKSSMLSFDPEDHDETGADDDDVDGRRGRNSTEKSAHKKHRKKHSKRENDVVKKTKREKALTLGMGYGGLILQEDDDQDEDGTRSDVRRDNEEDDGGLTALYDKAALEKLKMEQKRRMNEAREESMLKQRDDDKHHSSSSDQVIHAGQEAETADRGRHEEEFIPLFGAATRKPTSDSEPIVLTGDDAMAYATRQEHDEHLEFDHGLEQHAPAGTMDIQGINLQQETPDEEMEQEHRQWEDNMARRAGVLPPSSANSSSKPTIHQQRDDTQSTPSSLSQIKSTLEPTITNLENISSDLQTSLCRHESIVSSTREELTKHQSTLQHHGKALEYYQELRQDLAAWIGALRLIKKMVDAVTDARMKWEGHVTRMHLQRWWEWGADVRSVLVRRGLLERTIGGDEEIEDANEEVAGVDEFGRDLSSMETMTRTKRWEARRRTFLQRRGNGNFMSLQERMNCISSDNISTEELQEWRQRSQALTDAIGIIPNMVRDDYLSISNLCSLFFQWQEKYPDDYRSCYAEMSLVAMISVLVRLELCQKWDGLGLEHYLNDVAKENLSKPASMSGESQSLNKLTEYSWFNELRQSLADKSNLTSGSSKLLHKVIEKCILSSLLAYLTIDSLAEDNSNKNKMYCGLYNPVSAAQTKWLCSSFKSLFDFLSTSSYESNLMTLTIAKVATSLLALLKYCVGKRPTPIVNTKNLIMIGEGFALDNGPKEFDAETSDAIACAIYSQAKELCMLATNILIHWYPIINDSKNGRDDSASPIVRFILVEVVSMRVLPIVHTFQTITQQSCSNAEKQTCPDMQKSLIHVVYDAVKTAGLFEQEEFMLFTAPLRAAANAIGIT